MEQLLFTIKKLVLNCYNSCNQKELVQNELLLLKIEVKSYKSVIKIGLQTYLLN